MTRSALVLPVLALLAPVPAVAQAATGTGGGPTTTVTAPNTSSVGQTMPRAGRAGTPAADTNREERTAQQRADDKITRGICIGCGPQ